jgi:hypothetical protein
MSMKSLNDFLHTANMVANTFREGQPWKVFLTCDFDSDKCVD